MDRPARILLVRGYQATLWELRPWELLPPDRFEVAYLRLARNWFDDSAVQLRRFPVKALSSYLPSGRIGSLMIGATGDRYVDADEAFAWADVVHAAELSYWFAADAARRKPRNGYKLALTVWETIPFLDSYRNRYAKTYRRETLVATDLFLPTTQRARQALLLEGAEPERTEVLSPGVDFDRFESAPRPEPPPTEHVVVSPGRLVWEKGHQDVMRALAALRSGLVPGGPSAVRLLIVGAGPEEARLRAYAGELGIADAVEFRSVPYEEMPAVFAGASCMVLASLATASGGYVLGDIPRFFWEEQFGLVLAEAMGARLPILASQSGAIPEVAGDAATYFLPGDWIGLARALAEGPLSRPPGERADPPEELVRRYSIASAADRLASAYDRLLER
ncbi:MAG: glycosyltransferase family 4 protein [Gaiellaceae bacterium]|jgi:glycosyltransferase involved in cell wall biosynthesis|nr:glycosyltransferase family 4 protein [Gaiellaceae bacterium]